jgi:excisionase family DNA binding protein
MSKHSPDVLTLNEVAEYLRIPRSTAYKLAQEGKIPGQKVGRHWRFHRTVVENWLGHRPGTQEGANT